MRTQTKTARPDTTISIRVDLEVTLSHEEVWPDWDGEEEMTAAAIAELIENDGMDFFMDWNLHPVVEVEVTTTTENPHYHGDDVLFGDAPKPTLTEITEAEAFL